MYHNEVKALQEAYSQVYEKMEYERDMDHPKTTRETKAGDPNQIRTLDQMIESLVERGHTEQEAYTLVAQFTLDEAITSEKGKAKAAEMIANRTTASGRAKSGQGANVAAIKHIRRANVDGYGGTPPNLKVAKNPVKSNFTGLNTGTGNKAARRAAALKKEDFELWVNELVEEGYDLSDYTWDEMYGIYEAEKPFPHEKVKAKQVALRDKGSAGLDRRMKMGMAVRRAKEAEKTGGSQRDAGKGWYHAKEDYVNESQAARNNPEKYERGQAKKSAPVRGEKTPMPPRGDKRREDFEKWYAKQMGR